MIISSTDAFILQHRVHINFKKQSSFDIKHKPCWHCHLESGAQWRHGAPISFIWVECWATNYVIWMIRSIQTSVPNVPFVDCHSRRLGIDRQCTHSLHRNDMAYCHFELCHDCGVGCFSELLLADIRRLSVVAVVFLYQITFFTTKHNSITFGTLF